MFAVFARKHEGFLPADKHENFLQVDSICLVLPSYICPKIAHAN